MNRAAVPIFSPGAVLRTLCLAAIFTALCLEWSLARGRLSQDPTFDDSGYLLDGGQRLATLYDKGLGSFASGLVSNPPHSAFSTLGAVLAFALCGFRDWAPYAFNGVVILALLLFVDYVARGLDGAIPWLCKVFVLTLPLSLVAIHDYRPDLPCALLTAIGIYLALETGVFRREAARTRGLAAAGAAFGVALWIKPSFFAHTLAMGCLSAGVVACLAFWPWRRERLARGLAAAARDVCLILLTCGLVAAPYYAINFRQTLGYFLVNTVGANGDVWKLAGGWGAAVKYYTVGEAGKLMLGRGCYAGIAAWLAAVGWLLWGRHWRELLLQGSLLLLSAASLTVMIYGRISNPFFGLTYQILLIFAALRGVAVLLAHLPARRGPRILAAGVLGLLCLVSASLLRPGRVWTNYAPAINQLVGLDQSINLRIVQDIRREFGVRAAQGRPFSPMVYVTHSGFVNATTMQWRAFQLGARLTFVDNYLDRQLEDYRQYLSRADFVVCPEEETAGVFESLPAYALRLPINEIVAGEVRAGHLRLLQTYPTVAAGAYRVYVNDDKLADEVGDFGHFLAWDGFLPVEGPYPQLGIGLVRWCLSPVAKVTQLAAVPGRANLKLSGRADQPVHLDVALDGTPIAHLDVLSDLHFHDFTVPVELAAGTHEFSFACPQALPAGPDGLRRAVLFRMVDLESNP